MKILRRLPLVILVLSASLAAVFFWASGPARRIPSAGIIHFPEYEKNLPKAPKNITVMTYNVGYASGLKNNLGNVLSRAEVYTNLDKIALCLQKNNIDIAGLQEIDLSSARTFGIDQLKYLAHKAEYPYLAYAVNWNKRYLPFPVTLDFSKHFGSIISGIAVLSKFPITENMVHVFVKPANNSFLYNAFYIDRDIQMLSIRLEESKQLYFNNLHLEAYDIKSREAQVGDLVRLLKARGFPGGISIVTGDFNALLPGATQKNGFMDEPDIDFAGDNSLQVMVEQSGLLEPFLVAGTPGQETFSFPSGSPTRGLDHIFFSPGLRLKRVFVDREAGSGSDHLPVSAVFELP